MDNEAKERELINLVAAHGNLFIPINRDNLIRFADGSTEFRIDFYTLKACYDSEYIESRNLDRVSFSVEFVLTAKGIAKFLEAYPGLARDR